MGSVPRLLASLAAVLSCQVAFSSAKMVYMLETGTEKQIIVANADGTAPKALTSGTRWHLYPDLNASGTQVVFVEGESETQTDLMLLDLKTGSQMKLTNGEGRYLHPDFAGNGRALAFSGPAASVAAGTAIPQISIWRLGASSGQSPFPVIEKRETLTSDFPRYFPQLASDASFVVFQQNLSAANKTVVKYDLDSKTEKVLSPADASSMSPALSFDDRWVAFTTKVEGDWEIYLHDLRSSSSVRVTQNPGLDLSPTFRADGALVFVSDRDGGELKLQIISKDELAKKSFRSEALAAHSGGNIYAPGFSGDTEPAQGLLPSIPAPSRSSFGAVRVGSKVYVVGGHQGAEHTYPESSFLSRVDIYDMDTKQWAVGSPRPSAAHGFGLAAYGKFIYAFGGFAYSAEHLPKWRSLDEIDRYDTEKNEWVTVGHLPRRRSSNAVSVVGNNVYLIGGWDSTPKFAKDFEGIFHPEIDVFDMDTETVSTLTEELQAPLRRALSSVTMGTEVFLVGGISEGAEHFNLIDNVTVFQTADRTFRELPPLPFATFAPAAGVIGGSLYVFGGMYRQSADEFVYVNHVYALGAAPNSAWRNVGRFLKESKGFSQVVSLGSQTLGLLGGHSYEGDNAPVATFETFSSLGH